MSRAIRAILPRADGGIAHLFVVYGFQRAEVDPHELALTTKLMEGVLGEARACGTGQPDMIIADLDAEPVIILATAKAIFCGHFIDLEKAYTLRRGEQPSPTCIFDVDGGVGTGREFFIVLSQCFGSLYFL